MSKSLIAFFRRRIPLAVESKEGLYWRVLFFSVLFVLFWALDAQDLIDRVRDIYEIRGGLIPLVFYAFIWTGLIFSLQIIFSSDSTIIRIFSYLFSFFTVGIFIGFKLLNGSGYGYNEALLTVNEFELAGEALVEYSKSAFLGALLAFLIIAAIAWISETRVKVFRKHYLAVVFFFIACMGYIVQRNPDLVIEDFPVVFNVPAITFAAFSNHMYSGPREEPFLEAGVGGKAQHIILIMDESVRGDCLGINNPLLRTTPYLDSLDDRLINLGIACSAGNQSSGSNLVVRTGLSPSQIPDKNQLSLKNPTLFQYAARSGRKTCFINAQKSRFENYMTREDFSDIDQYVFIPEDFPEKPKWMRDHVAADCIRRILESDEETFTFVLKSGAHFPYRDTYPGDEVLLSPASYSSGSQPVPGSFTDEIFLEYTNAIRWNVDEFFKKLLPEIQNESCLIFYISDHGQSLGHGKDLIRISTHNTPHNPPGEQANTPMFIYLTGPDADSLDGEAISRLRENKDKLSHFQVFPTLLYFFGYEKSEVNQYYGETIFDRVPEERYFFSGDFFGRSMFEKNLFVQNPGE